jgi:hypothetical protein
MRKLLTIEKLIALLACAVLFVYWSATILYVTPNNPVRIAFTPEMDMFQTFFFQRWGFFAPPPKANGRLYYHFMPVAGAKDARELTIEVLQPIYQAKQKNAPFNEQETILDYIVSGAVDQTLDYFRYQHNLKSTLNALPATADTNLVKAISSYLESTNSPNLTVHSISPDEQLLSSRTLQNYSFFVAKKNHLALADYDVEIIATHIPLPSFNERKSIMNGAGSRNSDELYLFRIEPFKIPRLN